MNDAGYPFFKNKLFKNRTSLRNLAKSEQMEISLKAKVYFILNIYVDGRKL